MDTLTVQVWKLDFTEFKSPAAKLVALALARRSRDSGQCWARQGTIGGDCGVSKQTVARCLAELEEKGWVQRVERKRSDGGRTSDMLWLTLPEMVLPGTMVDHKEAKRIEAEEDDSGTTVETPPITVAAGHPSSVIDPPLRESTPKESLKESDRKDSHVPPDDLNLAVDLIWSKASKMGRQRSSRLDLIKAMRAALDRGHAMETILRGMGGYLSSHDATKEDGTYQRGAHVMLANDRFMSFLDEGRAIASPTPAEAAAGDQALSATGTMERPSETLQRAWMDLYTHGMPWNPERGPRPGLIGCRVAPEIQREFGEQPYVGPAAPAEDDNAAALD